MVIKDSILLNVQRWAQLNAETYEAVRIKRKVEQKLAQNEKKQTARVVLISRPIHIL